VDISNLYLANLGTNAVARAETVGPGMLKVDRRHKFCAHLWKPSLRRADR